MKRTFSNKWLSVVLALLLLFITAGSAGAVTYNITAEVGNLTLPGTTTQVPIWGYSLTDATGAATGAPSVPGPVIEVPPGESLTINLFNYLGEATSLHILGQQMSNNTGPVFPADGRVLSFTHQAAAGGSATYIWNNINPGTYMLQSATHPARQVQMGLFAAVKADFAAGQAYNGVAYDDDRILVFHEIDPDFHLAPDTTPIVHRHPRYFLINGAAHPDPALSLADVSAGQTVLLRFVNAGLETHVPQILNSYLSLVAQDGIKRSYDQEVYGFELNSAGTMDAILQVDAADEGASFPIYDARVKHLTNAGDTFGGMLVKLNVGAGTPVDTVTILRTRYNTGQSQLRVWATSNDPDAVLTVSDPVAGNINNVDFIDANVLNGEFTRMFVANVAANPGTTTVTSDSGGSATAAVAFTAPPEAFDDAAATDQGQAQIIAALANDLKGGHLLNAHALRPVLQTAPANGTAVANPDGTITYTPNGAFSGPDSFTYAAQAYNTNNGNILATSAAASVSVFVNPSNAAPTAVGDSYNGTEGATLNVPAPGVLANDSDPEGSALTAVPDSGPTAGTLTLNSDGSFSFDGPAGSHSFTYVANDGALNSTPATVTLNINDLPAAAVDSYSTDENVDLMVSAANGVLANDSDAMPAGGALSATLVSTTGQGILNFSPDGSFTYAPGFNFSGTDSFSYTVSDELGAVSAPATATITVINAADTVTITRLRWRNNQTRARIIATSSAPAGSAVLTAFANFDDGGPAQELGTLRYRAQNGDYRATLPFDTNRGLPVTITVTSDQGGTDTRAIPTN